MMETVINDIVGRPPTAGRITFARLDGSTALALPDLYAAAGRVAAGLVNLGVGRGDRIGILAANCQEWVLLDLAALRIGAVTAGFEPEKFEAREALLRKYNLSLLFTDRSFDAPRVLPTEQVATMAGAEPVSLPDPVRYRPTDITTIKFTSGSTGEPKGLAATVGSIDSSISAVEEMFEHGPGDDVFIFLPLSLLQQRYWIYSALRFGHDVTVSTYQAAFMTMPRAQPTVVMGVPAFFETAKKLIETRGRRESTDGALAQAALAQAAVGLFGPRIRYLWTGSAPARPEMLDFFESVGLPIYEGYGLNEACIVAKNSPKAHRRGSVGQVLPRKRVLFDEEGVISVHSDFPVNSRYEYAMPGDSERIFGEDGTVRTGDLGHLDSDGFLFVQGRADDVIVLDNGRKVIVRPIEEQMRASPAIAECVLLCPTQTHLVAVVSPASDPPDEAAISDHLARTNEVLTRDEQIRGVVVARERFTEENGLLTSQFKPRRKQILDAYRHAVEGLMLRPGVVLADRER